MSRVWRQRWLLADPVTVFAVTAGLFFGGVGATYPTAFLGETAAPGAAAGLLLGLVAALGTSPVWVFPLAVGSTAAATAQALRAVQHAHGHGQLAVRRTELLYALSRIVFGAGAGAIGGLISALCQQANLESPSHPLGLAPSGSAYAMTLGIAALSVAAGYLLGSATSDVSAALMVVAVVVAVSATLVGASYYSPTLGTVASATPLGALLVATKDQLVAPQFVEELSTVPAVIGALLWIFVSLVLAVRRARRQVS